MANLIDVIVNDWASTQTDIVVKSTPQPDILVNSAMQGPPGPPGPAGAFAAVSADQGNTLSLGSDDGLYIPAVVGASFNW
jgi:hypothetical protein